MEVGIKLRVAINPREARREPTFFWIFQRNDATHRNPYYKFKFLSAIKPLLLREKLRESDVFRPGKKTQNKKKWSYNGREPAISFSWGRALAAKLYRLDRGKSQGYEAACGRTTVLKEKGGGEWISVWESHVASNNIAALISGIVLSRMSLTLDLNRDYTHIQMAVTGMEGVSATGRGLIIEWDIKSPPTYLSLGLSLSCVSLTLTSPIPVLYLFAMKQPTQKPPRAPEGLTVSPVRSWIQFWVLSPPSTIMTDPSYA